MSIITPAMSTAFIANATFPAPPRDAKGGRARRRGAALADEPPLDLRTNDAQAIVVGSGLIVAAARVPVQTRMDLVNCTLFAQLAASGEVGDSARVSEWYDAYFRALTSLGWSQSDTRFEDYSFESRNAEAHEAIISVIAALLGPAAAAVEVIRITMNALQTMQENSPWITLFERQSKAGKSARFQVAVAQVDEGGLLQVALVAFELTTRATLTQVLFFRFSSNATRLKYAAGTATIYAAALDGQRAAIDARLAEYRAAYVRQVSFPPPPGRRASAAASPRPSRRGSTARR